MKQKVENLKEKQKGLAEIRNAITSYITNVTKLNLRKIDSNVVEANKFITASEKEVDEVLQLTELYCNNTKNIEDFGFYLYLLVSDIKPINPEETDGYERDVELDELEDEWFDVTFDSGRKRKVMQAVNGLLKQYKIERRVK